MKLLKHPAIQKRLREMALKILKVNPVTIDGIEVFLPVDLCGRAKSVFSALEVTGFENRMMILNHYESDCIIALSNKPFTSEQNHILGTLCK